MSEALANTRPFVHLHIHTEYSLLMVPAALTS